MDSKIIELASALKSKSIARRRDFHKHAETGWTEFRTASIVAEILSELGYEVLIGDAVIDEQAMMGVPSTDELKNHMERALNQGANPVWLEKMNGGKTGVVGIKRFNKPGPTVALRFDMDANDLIENGSSKHRPYASGFSSINAGAMHACGHDGHTAVGLTVAEIISKLSDDIGGTVKLIFQPAEEGVRGAKAMVEKGVVDDVDFFVGMHLGAGLYELGQLGYKAEGFLATTKLDVDFLGKPAHAGATPEEGKNALLAAANALINLHAISRHSQGVSRINVGVLQGGSGRNVIPDRATIKLEIRGANRIVHDYIYQEAIRIIKATGAMHDVTVESKIVGSATAGINDEEAAECTRQVAARLGLFKEVVVAQTGGGSEDCTCFMERVQKNGGKAVYTIVGTEVAGGIHNSCFDFNEDALKFAAIFLTCTVVECLTKMKVC